MQLPAISSSHLPLPAAPTVPPVPAPTETLPRATLAFAAPAYGFADYDHSLSQLTNLSQVSKPVYEALQSASAFPPSANPTYVLPPNSNFLRLFSAVQAIAAERIYPAPVFSFRA
jgi:hypothetical protein